MRIWQECVVARVRRLIRPRTRTLLSVLLPMLTFTWVAAPAFTSAAHADAHVVFRIKNHANGRCLDADANGIHSNGDRVQLWDCTGGSNQLWYYNFLPSGAVQVVNAANGKCLDADAGGSNSNGDKVQLWDCVGGINQVWDDVDNPPFWLNEAHGLCLDADGNGLRTNGDRVQLWACNGGANQQWN
jgi:hypothetical protein